MSSIIKDDYCYLELAAMHGSKTSWSGIRDQCKVSREAPIAPDAFERLLRDGVAREEADPGTGIKFTSGNDLTKVVIPQYKNGFLKLMGEATALMYTSLGWGDEAMQQLSSAFMYAHANGSMRNFVDLRLSNNRIGDEGMKAFSAATSSGSLRALTRLDLDGNQIGDAGMTDFSRAIASGSLPACNVIGVRENPGNAASLKAACEERGIMCLS